jgi:hypothetical protein
MLQRGFVPTKPTLDLKPQRQAFVKAKGWETPEENVMVICKSTEMAAEKCPGAGSLSQSLKQRNPGVNLAVHPMPFSELLPYVSTGLTGRQDLMGQIQETFQFHLQTLSAPTSDPSPVLCSTVLTTF